MKFTIIQFSVSYFLHLRCKYSPQNSAEMPQIYVLSSQTETVTSDEWLKLFLPALLTNLQVLFYDALSAASQNVEWYDDYKIWREIY